MIRRLVVSTLFAAGVACSSAPAPAPAPATGSTTTLFTDTTLPGATVPGTPLTPSAFSFGTATFTVAPSACSPLTPTVTDSSGSTALPQTNLMATLATTSTGGAFFSDAGCTMAAQQVTFAAGAGAAPTLYYRDSVVGTATLSMSDASGTGLTPGSASVTVSTSGGTNTTGINVLVNGISGMLSVQPSLAVHWTFTAQSVTMPNDQVVVYNVLPTPQPASMMITGNGTSSVSITWTPQSTDPTSGTLDVRTRDMTACAAAGSQTCNIFTTPDPAHDTDQIISWTMSGTSGTTGGSGFLSTVLGILLPSLSGGGGLSSLFGSLGGGTMPATTNPGG